MLDRHGMPKVTNKTITDRAELFEALAEVRDRGVTFDDEERVDGMHCVAALVTDNNDHAIAALNISAPIICTVTGSASSRRMGVFSAPMLISKPPRGSRS